MKANLPKKKEAIKKQRKYVTGEELEEQYLSKEDNFIYEWINGIIFKLP